MEADVECLKQNIAILCLIPVNAFKDFCELFKLSDRVSSFDLDNSFGTPVEATGHLLLDFCPPLLIE